MEAEHNHEHTVQPIRLAVATATFEDIREALRAGLRDFANRPGLSLFLGLF